jgi:glycosyltransferase involved in cell wall biosynthesis
MRLAVDGYISGQGFGGFYHYAKNLIQGLARFADELVVYVPDESSVNLDLGLERPHRIRTVPFRLDAFESRTERDVTWHQDALPSALTADGIDLLFAPAYFLPLNWSGRSVLTIHDLVFERYPEYFSPENIDLYGGWGRRSAEQAAGLVTVSSTTAADVETYWKIVGKPIAITHLGPSIIPPARSREKSYEIVASELGVSKEFVLGVGINHPRKNPGGVLGGYAKLPTVLRSQYELVLVNSDHPLVWSRIKEFGIADQVRVLDWVPDALMSELYNSAKVVSHPSNFEGFGMPILDAMSCGTPVVTSSRPAIPEVAGDSVKFASPDDQQAIADALEEVLTDNRLWDNLAHRGLERSARFSWEETVSRTWRLIQDVAKAR